MASSTQLRFSLALLILTAISIPDVSHAQAIEDCALRKRGAVNNAYGGMQSTGNGEEYGNQILQASDIATANFVSAIQKLGNMPQPCVEDDAWANGIKQDGRVSTANFNKYIELLVFPPSCGMVKNAEIESVIQEATPVVINGFRNVITELVEFYLGGSKIDAVDNAFANAIRATGETVKEAFSDILTKLQQMPAPCSAARNSWANSILKSTDVLSGSLGILVSDELLLSQYTGLANYLTADQANELTQAALRHRQNQMYLIRQYVALLTGKSV